VRESTRTTDKEAAKRPLKDKEGRAARGEIMLPRVDRVTFDEARADLVAYYTTRKTRDLGEAEARLKHLDTFFSGRRLVTIGDAEITEYAQQRQAGTTLADGTTKPGAANGTVNRELETLSKLMRLAYKRGKLQRFTGIEKLPESAPRAGFVTADQFASIRKRLPEELQAAVSVAYTFGWRKREVLDLCREHYDAQEGTLRLDPGTTKNDDGSVVYLTPEIAAMLETQARRVRDLERKTGRIIPWLFPHLGGAYAGERISDPRKAWKSACKAAGRPGTIIHDLRRSAVRNLTGAGVSDVVAMKMTGHRTRSVFDRYNIVSAAELQDAAVKLEEAASRFQSRSAASLGNTAR